MKSDMEIKIEGLKALSKNLDPVELERFVVLINREKFDYTKWRQNLFEDMTLEEISAAAEKYSKEHYPS